MSNKTVLISGLACGLLLVILVNVFTGEDAPPAPVIEDPVTAVNPPETPSPAVVPEPTPPAVTEQAEAPAEPTPREPALVTEESAGSEEEIPPPEPQPATLPDLNESDRFVMTQVNELDNASAVIFQMTGEQIIRKFVVLVDGMSRGDIPARDLPVLPPREDLDVTELEDGRFRLEPSSYARFDQLVNTFTAMDSATTAELIMRMAPLFESAYAELGYPDQAFNDALQEAIDNVLNAPQVPEGEVLLTRPVVNYEYADPALENRTTLEKLLIRMGPENAARVQQKVREISTFLGSL